MARTVVAVTKPRNDAYTGLLAISLLALVGASVLLFLDKGQLGEPPAKLKIDVPGSTAGKAGETLPKTDAPKAPDAKDTPKGPDPKGDPMSRAEPGRLPNLDAGGPVVPVSHEGPPLPVKPFIPE